MSSKTNKEQKKKTSCKQQVFSIKSLFEYVCNFLSVKEVNTFKNTNSKIFVTCFGVIFKRRFETIIFKSTVLKLKIHEIEPEEVKNLVLVNVDISRIGVQKMNQFIRNCIYLQKLTIQRMKLDSVKEGLDTPSLEYLESLILKDVVLRHLVLNHSKWKYRELKNLVLKGWSSYQLMSKWHGFKYLTNLQELHIEYDRYVALNNEFPVLLKNLSRLCINYRINTIDEMATRGKNSYIIHSGIDGVILSMNVGVIDCYQPILTLTPFFKVVRSFCRAQWPQKIIYLKCSQKNTNCIIRDLEIFWMFIKCLRSGVKQSMEIWIDGIDQWNMKDIKDVAKDFNEGGYYVHASSPKIGTGIIFFKLMKEKPDGYYKYIANNYKVDCEFCKPQTHYWC